MARHHANVNYVEPNYSSVDWKVDDEYDRAGKCINGITVTPKEGIADVNNDIVKSVADILSHLSDGIWSYYAIASY